MKFLTQYTKDDIKELLKAKFVSGERVVIKMHFGEPGSQTAFKPEDVKPFVDALSELGFDVLMVDTPVAYDSPRNTKEGYEKSVKERGYDAVGKYKIEDEYVKVVIDGMEFEVAKVLAEAKNVLVLSHVKGHACAGFGGAIKNLGMGALAAKTKSMIHAASKPVVDTQSVLAVVFVQIYVPQKLLQ